MLLMNSLFYKFENIFWFSWHRCTCGSEFGIITRLSIFQSLTALHLSTIILSALCTPNIPTFFYICVPTRDSLWAKLTLGPFVRCRPLRRLGTREPAHYLSISHRSSWGMPVALCYSSSLVHRAASISILKSLKRIESTAAVVFSSFSLVHSPVRFHSSAN